MKFAILAFLNKFSAKCGIVLKFFHGVEVFSLHPAIAIPEIISTANFFIFPPIEFNSSKIFYCIEK